MVSLLTLATFLVKPLGVSTQFLAINAVVIHQIAPGLAEKNTYLAKYGEKSDWSIGYGWMLVIGMLFGRGVTISGEFFLLPSPFLLLNSSIKIKELNKMTLLTGFLIGAPSAQYCI